MKKQKPKSKVIPLNKSEGSSIKQNQQSKNTKVDKNVQVKYATVKTFQVTRGKRNSKVSKFKRWVIETVCKLTIKDTYYYEVILNYTNGRLQPKDVVVNEAGVVFYVLNESNRVAKLITYNALDEKPFLKGKIQIHRSIKKED